MATESEVARPIRNYWRDIAWLASGSTLAQLVGIAGFPILTRLYSPGDFAVQALFLQVVTLATAVVTWRYEYFVQLPKSDDDALALNGLVMCLGLFAVLILSPLFWIFQEGIAERIGNRDVGRWLVLAPATAVLVSWGIASQNNAQRLGDFKTSGLAELTGKLAYVISGIAGALVQLGTAGLVVTTAIGAILKSACVFLFSPMVGTQRLRIRAEPMQQVRTRYGRLATSTVFAHLLAASSVTVPQVAMAHLYGADAVGQFALVLATIYLPSGLLGAAIGQVYYQRAAQQWADGSSFFALWRATVNKLLIIGVPVYGMAALLSGFAYPYVFGSQWHLAGEFATWMSLAAFGSFVSSPMDRTCLVVGAGSYLMIWSAYRALSTLFVAWLGWSQGFTPSSFVVAMVIQMSVTYGIDLWMSFRFSQGRLGVFEFR